MILTLHQEAAERGNGKVLSSYVIINGSSGKLIENLIDCVSLML